jgi:parvulin-like peptidyl-prolyl isomerase
MEARKPAKVPHLCRPTVGLVLCGVAVLAAAWTLRWGFIGSRYAEAKPPGREAGRAPLKQAAGAAAAAVGQGPAPATPSKPDVVAVVNAEEISRRELEQACLIRHGKDVLEGLVNKEVIAEACRRHQISVSAKDVDAEIERMAQRFRLGKEQWLALLEKERGITAEQYAQDIVWPTLALKRLADREIVVSPDEIQKEYESQFGPAVKARLIAVPDIEVARQIHAELLARPGEFVRLAREKSQDVGSASLGGLIPPIRRHMLDAETEQVVFRLQHGELSPVVRLGEQYAIFRCEEHLPPRQVPAEEVADALRERVRDRKLHNEADTLFTRLQAESKVVNVMNDPEAQRRAPGVAATLNGRPITIEMLAEACVARHGREVLEGQIGRRLIAQALRKANLAVSQQEIHEEMLHAAEFSGILDAQGRPDVEKWLEASLAERSTTREVLIEDAVWPAAALRKLAEKGVAVSEEDLQKGFEANYGRRVRCRAIVMNNLRKAQEIWDAARRTPTVEHFGRLAETHSIEPNSRAMQGEIPPIRKNGGQPVLEREAFALEPHQISGIVQVGENYVILFCEGHTEPVAVEINEVRDLIHRDLYDKKLQLAMSETFEHLQDSSQIDNLLTGTSRSPKREGAGGAVATGAAATTQAESQATRPKTAPVRR